MIVLAYLFGGVYWFYSSLALVPIDRRLGVYGLVSVRAQWLRRIVFALLWIPFLVLVYCSVLHAKRRFQRASEASK
ncbi:hypothetical protein EON81_23445 [bacterium]|nr:MAG: hypothetical protein EON81_23445 [bacterium]